MESSGISFRKVTSPPTGSKRRCSQLIRALAEYERLAHEVILDENQLREHLFGPRPYAEVLDVAEGPRVEQRRQGVEAPAGLGLLIVEAGKRAEP